MLAQVLAEVRHTSRLAGKAANEEQSKECSPSSLDMSPLRKNWLIWPEKRRIISRGGGCHLCRPSEAISLTPPRMYGHRIGRPGIGKQTNTSLTEFAKRHCTAKVSDESSDENVTFPKDRRGAFRVRMFFVRAAEKSADGATTYKVLTYMKFSATAYGSYYSCTGVVCVALLLMRSFTNQEVRT